MKAVENHILDLPTHVAHVTSIFFTHFSETIASQAHACSTKANCVSLSKGDTITNCELREP
jgi:hypothetical protein